MATLNVYGNYAEQMLSLYLWGQTTPPALSELADDKWILQKYTITTAEIYANAYMSNIGYRLKLAEQKIFQLFL